MLRSKFNNLFHMIVTLVSFVLIIFVVLFSNKTGQLELKAGEVAHEDVYAPRAVIDEKTTAELREAARNNVPDVLVQNDEKRIYAVNTVKELFDYAALLRDRKTFLPVDNTKELINNAKIKISEETATEILSANDAQFALMSRTSSIVDAIMSEKVSDIDSAKQKSLDAITQLALTDNQKNAAYEITSLVISNNIEVDAQATEQNRQQAADAVQPVEYKKNQIIVRKGDIVSEAQIDMLTRLGLLKGTSPLSFTYTLGVFLLMIICYAILLFYFWNKKKKDTVSLPIIAVVGLLLVIISFYGSRYVPENMRSILPLGVFPGIVAIFSTPQTAIISNVMLSIFCGVAFEANWSHTICLIIAGTMSSYAFATVKRRSQLLPAAVTSAVFYGLTFCAMSFIEASSVGSAFVALGKGLLGGFLSGLITIGSIQFLEWLFGATTPMKLSELTNPENKLLKKLLVDAPGSYHHALTVANISEIAARSIQADSLLARAGAYYHDIGKIRHPLYFKENQYNKNAHDELTPFESSSIIISHVTDGVDIAKKHRLPEEICDIIAQHHGTTSTGYFLIRARELDPDVDEKKFCYPGPVPQSKEAAIVMLADSCEAAVRSIDEKSESKIETMVRKIASERVNSGQLSQCNLTFAELEKVIKVITKTLGGYFHERIKYE